MAFSSRRTRLGRYFSEGSQLLRAAIDGSSQNEAARSLGATTAMLTKWAFGDGRPSLDWAIKLRDKLGIPVDAWMKIAPAAEAAA